MSRYISERLKKLVAESVENLCEYCLIGEGDTFLGCQYEHIISVKHGGPTTAENLAYACAFCNRQKGSDIGSIVWETGEFVRFFNPRTDLWHEHFRLEGAQIAPLTAIGEVTARILGFNSADSIQERQSLIEQELYPNEAASRRMGRR